MKGYCSHLGPVVSPLWEDDKERARYLNYESNFYYAQVRAPFPLAYWLSEASLKIAAGGPSLGLLPAEQSRVGL